MVVEDTCAGGDMYIARYACSCAAPFARGCRNVFAMSDRYAVAQEYQGVCNHMIRPGEDPPADGRGWPGQNDPDSIRL